MPRNRFDEALFIQHGACNPSGVARSLVKAIDEARLEGGGVPSVRDDPAVRLICHQLAFLLNVEEINHGAALDVYGALVEACKAKAHADVIQATCGG